MSPDDALLAMKDLGENKAAVSYELRGQPAEILPTLVGAGYALVGGGTWRFTPLGIARLAELERRQGE